MTANTSLHNFAIEALKINTFLEEYITSPEIRLAYVLGILGGHSHPEAVTELVGGPGAADGVARRARYKPVRSQPGVTTYYSVDPLLRADDPIKVDPENFGVVPEAQDPKAVARARYDDWSDDVVSIGDIKDTDQVIQVVGAKLFKNRHAARLTVGIMLRTDPIRWRQLMTKAGGPRRRWGGSVMWERIDGIEPDILKPKTRRGLALSNSVRAEA